MNGTVIYSDEYIRIYSENRDVMAQTYKKGMPTERVWMILAEHPELGITNLNALRFLLTAAPAGPQKVGEIKNRIQLEISSDVLTAKVTFNIPAKELSLIPRDRLRNELNKILKENGIVFGVNTEFINGDLVPGRPYITARGIPAVDGSDAIVRMYELAEAKPEVSESGKVDFYEMSLINSVKPGDWLGERIEPTDGIPGKNIRGEEIKAARGKTIPLSYDKNSVAEIKTPGKTTLVSKINGAVNYNDGKISVSNHLEINGDAGVATGNIKFDGCVTVNGTINNGYSLEATKDIEINSPYGLGNIKSLVSTNGSIYIKGGVSSKDKVEIKAARNIYAKFADNCRIVCGETAHIGYYSFNSDIIAKSVVFDSSNGKVIGGCIQAEIYINAPVCGSELERKTVLEVKGFDRQALVRRTEEILREINDKKAEQQKFKMLASNTSSNTPDTAADGTPYISLSDKVTVLKNEIKALEEERKQIAVYLKTKGDGEITITKRIYPNCSIILGGITVKTDPGVGTHTFFLKDGEIKSL